MRLSTLLVLGVVCAALVPNATAAQSVIDPDASAVELRAPASLDCPTCTGCEATPGSFLDNCFETTAALTTWLWGGLPPPAGRTNAPNSLDSVIIRVGPGTFDPFECVGPSQGWVSLLGSGREHTRFVQDDPAAALGQCPGAIDVWDCTGMNFQDLTAEGLVRGANWSGDGNSFWQNVDFIADAHGQPACKQGINTFVYAWYDSASPTGQIFFWDARFVVRRPPPGIAWTLIPFGTTGADHWVYASDFFLDMSEASSGAIYETAIFLSQGSQMRVFGSTVRVAIPEESTGMGFVATAGVHAETGAVFHMHGGIINVNVAAQDRDVAAIRNFGGGFIHTPETAFNVRESVSGGGTSWRIKQDGTATILSPFQWPASTTPPNLLSEHGQDMFVKTDAGPGGDETRLFIYDDSCVSLWRDTTGSCL